ncbi:hypothetical protein T492DRAFT_117066 [Pavlovales sp. CCMP2436]|nr:hypothetical protein T492DRAFT_117066 [Pavlovales sp. CCMP2436]
MVCAVTYALISALIYIHIQQAANPPPANPPRANPIRVNPPDRGDARRARARRAARRAVARPADDRRLAREPAAARPISCARAPGERRGPAHQLRARLARAAPLLRPWIL